MGGGLGGVEGVGVFLMFFKFFAFSASVFFAGCCVYSSSTLRNLSSRSHCGAEINRKSFSEGRVCVCGHRCFFCVRECVCVCEGVVVIDFRRDGGVRVVWWWQKSPTHPKT